MSRPDSRLAIKQVNRWTNRSPRVHQKCEECHRRRVQESSHSHELAASMTFGQRNCSCYQTQMRFSCSQVSRLQCRVELRDLAATECHPSPVTIAISLTECKAGGQVRVSGKIPGRDVDNILRISGALDDSDLSNGSLA
ncbi:hypothetical protein CEXT_204831 [Caerostris extrusa]|uniref:Uncharacterized protein n=1 Tax=Caerostris extrusa TaxID=172846 RepID=A0AAV4VLB4_CAEEX|nr:hypothetical protein CEXT_204831 [Caerostris extrusa]